MWDKVLQPGGFSSEKKKKKEDDEHDLPEAYVSLHALPRSAWPKAMPGRGAPAGATTTTTDEVEATANDLLVLYSLLPCTSWVSKAPRGGSNLWVPLGGHRGPSIETHTL